MTNPRTDKEAFDAYISRKKTELQNQEANPRVTFIDSLNKAIYGDNPRGQRFKLDMLDKVNYDFAMKMYKQRFTNGDTFTFTFVGNINPDSVKPIIEQYLGGLPREKAKETFVDVNMNPRKGVYSNTFDRSMETQRSSVFVFYSGNYEYTEKNIICMDMLEQIMNIVYTEKIRENESGTYGVRVYGDLLRYPSPRFEFQIGFDTDPVLTKKLLPIVYQELFSIMMNGPREVDFNKVKEFMLKKIKENKAENSYWLNVINELNFTNTDTATNYEEIVNRLTPEDIKDLATSIFNQGNKIEVIMNPKK
jgi:zinc protease